MNFQPEAMGRARERQKLDQSSWDVRQLGQSPRDVRQSGSPSPQDKVHKYCARDIYERASLISILHTF